MEIKNQCDKCICTSCINQPGCKRSCEMCKALQGHVGFCIDECRCEQIEMFGKENETNGK